MTKRPPGIVLYTEYAQHIALLSMEERGKLLTAVLEYGNGDNLSVSLSPCANMAFSFIKVKIDSDLEKYQNRCAQNSENGSLGGRPKKRPLFNETEISEGFSEKTNKANYNSNYNLTQSNLSPPIVPKGDDTTVELRFNSFWTVYPKHIGKQAALKAFKKLNPSENLLNTIIKAVEAQKQCQQWSELKYIPNASTWLNQARWEDDVSDSLQKSINTIPKNNSLLDKYF